MTRRSTLTVLRPTGDPAIDEERFWAFLAVLPTIRWTHRERVELVDTLRRYAKRDIGRWDPARRENRDRVAALRATAETLKTT
jgi:hypothetical protein